LDEFLTTFHSALEFTGLLSLKLSLVNMNTVVENVRVGLWDALAVSSHYPLLTANQMIIMMRLAISVNNKNNNNNIGDGGGDQGTLSGGVHRRVSTAGLQQYFAELAARLEGASEGPAVPVEQLIQALQVASHWAVSVPPAALTHHYIRLLAVLQRRLSPFMESAMATPGVVHHPALTQRQRRSILAAVNQASMFHGWEVEDINPPAQHHQSPDGAKQQHQKDHSWSSTSGTQASTQSRTGVMDTLRPKFDGKRRLTPGIALWLSRHRVGQWSR
jgi:hypothetical protein